MTEDYSEYESVDEEEPEEPKKKTAAKKAPAKAKKADEEENAPKSKPVARTNSVRGKTSGSKSAAGQGSLKDFFGKPKKS